MAPAARLSDGSSPSIRPVPSDQVSTGNCQAPPRPGRKKDPAWTLVDIDDDKSVWCRRCGKLIHTQGSNHIARVRRQVDETCTKLPPPPKITDTFKPKLQPTVLSAFHDAFARWVYTTGMPFYKVEHRTLLDALKVLHPGIELPSAYQLANAFLDSAFVKSIAAMEADLTGEVVTVVTDGWTDFNGLAVVNYVVAAGKKTYFLESVYTGSQSHDTEFLVRDARRVIYKYQFLNVGAIVTDNTAANKAMWEELQPDFPNVFFHGCVCHALHLLVKDMVAHIPWLDKLQAECKRLVVFFKTNHKLWFRLRQLMKAKNLKMLALPGDTRWGSLLACMSSILEAEDVRFSVVSGRNFMEAKTKKKRQARQLVFNLVTASDFVSKLKRAVALLKLVAKPMKQFGKNETPVSDVFKLFLDLPTSIETCGLPARDVKVVKGLVKERFDFIYGDAHGVAFLLDPRYRGLGMDSTTRGNVETLLVQWHDGDEAANEVVIELVRFHRFASEMSIKSPHLWEMLSSGKLSIYDYWCSLSQFPLLQSIAKRVFRCTPSSSASERNFSTHGFIHSRLRNRLEPDRVEKLVYVYFNARNIQDADMEMYSDLDDLLRLIDNDDEDDSTRDNRDADFVYE